VAGADTFFPFNKVYYSVQNSSKYYVSNRKEKPKYLTCYQADIGETFLVYDSTKYTDKYVQRTSSGKSWVNLSNSTSNDSIGYDSNGMYVCHSNYSIYGYTCIAVY
jgi:hypothetical protein